MMINDNIYNFYHNKCGEIAFMYFGEIKDTSSDNIHLDLKLIMLPDGCSVVPLSPIVCGSCGSKIPSVSELSMDWDEYDDVACISIKKTRDFAVNGFLGDKKNDRNKYKDYDFIIMDELYNYSKKDYLLQQYLQDWASKIDKEMLKKELRNISPIDDKIDWKPRYRKDWWNK